MLRRRWATHTRMRKRTLRRALVSPFTTRIKETLTPKTAIMFTTIFRVALLVLPAVYLYKRLRSKPASVAPPENPEDEKKEDEKAKTIMQPPKNDLAPPKDDPFTLEQLKQYDGSSTDKPIYVAIKGMSYVPLSRAFLH